MVCRRPEKPPVEPKGRVGATREAYDPGTEGPPYTTRQAY